MIDSFIKGVAANHEVVKYNIGDADLHYCKGCKKCYVDGKCVISDDVRKIVEDILTSDVAVIAAPSYWADLCCEVVMQEQIEAVQRMQEYISAHLSEDITLADLAEVAMYSPWYARRIFIAHTGLTPSDYIRRLRLRHSALRLRDENCLITDVAFDLGFGSVDGYTRAFAREFGCNPKQYALKPTPLALFNPYGVKFKYIAWRTKTMQRSGLSTT